MKKILIINTLIIILLGSSVYSQGPTVIGEGTTKKGQKVLILDDGTWKNKPKEIFKIPVGSSYYEGPSDAKVTIIEWMDYQ